MRTVTRCPAQVPTQSTAYSMGTVRSAGRALPSKLPGLLHLGIMVLSMRSQLALPFALLFYFSGQPNAHAEINIGESIEWLTAKADRIVAGKILKVIPASPAAGKSADLLQITLQAAQTLKGDAPQPSYCINVRHMTADKLTLLARAGTEVLLFLEQTPQATSAAGLTCNLWPLQAEGDYVPYIVPLTDPKGMMLSATTLKVLKDKASILSACRDAQQRLVAAGRATGAAKPRKTLLELPSSSEVYERLYSGSSTYLYVPGALFPSAKPSL